MTPSTNNKDKGDVPLRQVNRTLRWMTALMFFTVSVLAPSGLMRAAAAPDDEGVEAGSELITVGDDRNGGHGSRNRRSRTREAAFLSSWLLWRAQLAEPEITAALQDVSAGTDIGRQQWELKGLEYRFKDHGSLTRKILSKSADDAVSLEEAAHGIGDVLRYTLVSTDETGYAGAVPQALTFLTQRGFRVTKFHNAWGGKFYQGINVKLVSPVGQVVELQFHTPQSFAVKQASHEVYEIRRSPRSTPEEKAEAVRQSLAYNAMVQVPRGAAGVQWPMAA